LIHVIASQNYSFGPFLNSNSERILAYQINTISQKQNANTAKAKAALIVRKIQQLPLLYLALQVQELGMGRRVVGKRLAMHMIMPAEVEIGKQLVRTLTGRCGVDVQQRSPSARNARTIAASVVCMILVAKLMEKPLDVRRFDLIGDICRVCHRHAREFPEILRYQRIYFRLSQHFIETVSHGRLQLIQINRA
jgi:hypothetical protein